MTPHSIISFFLHLKRITLPSFNLLCTMSFKHKQYSYNSFQHEILLALHAIYHHNPNTGLTCYLINMVVNGRTPLAVRTTFGASLIALEKKGGGVRPIAVGPTLRCLAAKSLCSRVLLLVGASLSPLEFGCGTPKGAEAAAHAIHPRHSRRPPPS